MAIRRVQRIRTKYEPNDNTIPAKRVVYIFIPSHSITAIATNIEYGVVLIGLHINDFIYVRLIQHCCHLDATTHALLFHFLLGIKE